MTTELVEASQLFQHRCDPATRVFDAMTVPVRHCGDEHQSAKQQSEIMSITSDAVGKLFHSQPTTRFFLTQRDIDCAFTCMPTVQMCQATVRSRGTLINTGLTATFTRMEARFAQVPAQHVPHQNWKAVGADVQVSLRAFDERKICC